METVDIFSSKKMFFYYTFQLILSVHLHFECERIQFENRSHKKLVFILKHAQIQFSAFKITANKFLPCLVQSMSILWCRTCTFEINVPPIPERTFVQLVLRKKFTASLWSNFFCRPHFQVLVTNNRCRHNFIFAHTWSRSFTLNRTYLT